jgi:hypothetical protein
MAGYRSGTGHSVMLAIGPVLGRSCRWGFGATASAMDSLPDVDQEIVPNGCFLVS